jgi:hypothetical protein
MRRGGAATEMRRLPELERPSDDVKCRFRRFPFYKWEELRPRAESLSMPWAGTLAAGAPRQRRLVIFPLERPELALELL